MKSGRHTSIFQTNNCMYPPNYSVSSKKTATVTLTAMKISKSYKTHLLLTTQNRMHILQHSTSQDSACYNLFQYAHSSRMQWFCLFCYTDLNNSHSPITIIFLHANTNQHLHICNDIWLQQLVSHMCCQRSQITSTVVASAHRLQVLW
jgi:hypothetical protein